MNKVEELLTIIQNKGPRKKMEAVFELAKLGNFDKINVLIDGLHNEDWEIKSDAIYYLGRIGWYPVMHQIGNILENEEMYEIRNVAIYSLQSIGFVECIPNLIQSLKDESFEIREDSRNALYRIIGENILHLIDPDSEEFIEEDEEKKRSYMDEALNLSIWWTNNEKFYMSNKSYFFGDLSTPRRIFEKYKEDPFLNDAYLNQLEDMTGQSFGSPSKKIIELWEDWLAQNNDYYIEGNKYFFGNKITV